MGLDMYIHRKKKENKANIDEYLNNIEYEQWKADKVAYWRKANQIHKWFVDNIQDGVDDCNCYKVSKEQLEELLDLCNEVLNNAELKEGKVNNGYTYDKNGKHAIVEDGKVITNPEVCEELLPTNEGFFFGSTDYDEWYLRDIENTVEQLNYILDSKDFDEYEYFYHSSW